MSATGHKKKKRKPAKKVCRRVPVKGSHPRRYKKVCTAKKKKKPVKKPIGGKPVAVPSPAAPPVTTPVRPPTSPPPQDPPTAPGLPVYSGTFGLREAQRLCWRAGFGPKPGQAEALAALGAVHAVRSFTRPAGAATLTGAPPVTQDGDPIAPLDAWGHDHLWWLDRMVRSDQQLVERMTLVWHDWFANSNSDINNPTMMITQNQLFRTHALGSFADLVRDITTDPAMLVFLSGIENTRWAPNENYGRELMELFTLGADRGAYTETDVRQLARALTGWRADWVDDVGFTNFRFDSSLADKGTKTLWAGTAYQRSGAFDWRDACTLVLENPFHRSFFVLKLWSYFVPSPPSADTQAALESLYVSSGRSIGQVVEAILLHPDVYDGAPLVKPPAVFNAGLLRAAGQTIHDDSWAWRGDQAGQQLFYPPNVSGWNDRAWLDTSRLFGRWGMANEAFSTVAVTSASYQGSTETGAEALATALAFLGSPRVSPETSAVLLAFAELPKPIDAGAASYRALRQNALRMLAATSPDCQVA